MNQCKLITYQQAAELFRRAKLPASLRHVRTMIWLHPQICPVLTPVDGGHYHVKRMRTVDVLKLILHLKKARAL